MTTIIVPCAGKSSRFPDVRPKWMLTHPNGNLMVVEAVRQLPIRDTDRVIITILDEHNKKYLIKDGLLQNFNKIGLDVEVFMLDEATKSQSETVAETIRALDIKGDIYIKDSDNTFKINKIEMNGNYVTIGNLEDFAEINPANKSYAVLDEHSMIRQIVEKQVRSRYFSVGGYYFSDVKEFMDNYRKVKDSPSEVYISNVINRSILDGGIWFGVLCDNYHDWGTLGAWLNYKQKFKTYFIDIDGVLVRNSAEYFEPYWGTTESISDNIDIINKLHDAGNQIILTTSRNENYRDITEKQLEQAGLKYDKLVMSLLSAKRVLVNDFAPSNGYPSAVAINIPRNSSLKGYL